MLVRAPAAFNLYPVPQLSSWSSLFHLHFAAVGEGLLLLLSEQRSIGERRSRKRIQTRNPGGPGHVGFDPSDRPHELAVLFGEFESALGLVRQAPFATDDVLARRTLVSPKTGRQTDVCEPRERDDSEHDRQPSRSFEPDAVVRIHRAGNRWPLETGCDAREDAAAIHEAEPAMTLDMDTIALTTGDTGMRELDHRSSEDIEVALLWSERTNRVFVLVLEQRTEALFHFEVPPAEALDAFHHPYAYAQHVHLQDAVAA